ncbi:NlpC/P60 family protein [Streptomyces sp. NBC_00820]|uniref:C40 family peptidase n=1 Tax=Streptomyces sp. NBC_00820 TaxID=2975842 RepID=UPI002ED5D460|nr:NlpC/P60 family protein [Streptomyces sp. NBC_00820]
MAPESRDEVRQRIDSLYDRAENATGNFNATRAMAAAARRREAPPARRTAQPSDPALEAVTRQWFDAARAKAGPTMPAVLPADRLPAPPAPPARTDADRTGPAPVAPPAELPALPAGVTGQSGPRALPELTGAPAVAPGTRPRLAVEAGGAGLPGGPLAELPPARRAELPSGPAETAVLPVAALPAAQEAAVQAPGALPAAATEPRRPSPADFKTTNQRKLGTARDLLARHQAPAFPRPGTPDPLTDTGSLPYPTYTEPAPATPVTDTGSFAVPGAFTAPADTGSFAVPGAFTAPADTGSFTLPTIPDSPFATGSFTLPAPLGSLADASAFAPPVSANSPYDTGSFTLPTTLGSPAGTGAFAPPVTANSPADTGSFTLPVPAPESTHAGRAARAIEFARAQIGKPCVWGATGPDSYDCSSLTQGAWKAAGVTLPRTAHQQALAGAPMTLAGIEPGDLVLFFDDDRHVGLHVGDGVMIHAPGPGAYIREESIYGAGEQAIHRVIRPA